MDAFGAKGSKMYLIINDVGDGNHIQFISRYHNMFTIDYGSQQRNQYFAHNGLFIPWYDTNSLLISHYHTDHYNGLFLLPDNSINLTKVYYPNIPDFPQKKVLSKMILFLEYLTLGSDSGSPANDLLNLIGIKNKNDLFYRSLKQGDIINFNHKKMNVIWPPQTITNKQVLKTLSKSIEKINDVISSNDELQILWDNFDRNSNTESEIYVKKVKEYSKKAINIDKSVLSSFAKSIHDITNRFSVCLFEKENFLFLGDLESNEIRECILYLKKNYKINQIKYLITAHHGTHWNQILLDIHAKKVITSNGEKMVVHFDDQYKLIGDKSYSTFQNGSLIFKRKNYI